MLEGDEQSWAAVRRDGKAEQLRGTGALKRRVARVSVGEVIFEHRRERKMLGKRFETS